MKEILFKIRNKYEQNRKLCVVEVETLSEGLHVKEINNLAIKSPPRTSLKYGEYTV